MRDNSGRRGETYDEQFNLSRALSLSVTKKLNIQDKEYRFKAGGRAVVLSPPLPDVDISDSDWLIMNARGFDCEADAKNFARKLKSACEISSVSARLGIDSGTDLPTGGFGNLVKDRVRAQSGLLLRDNVHGVDVFLDDPNVRIAHLAASGTVRASPNPFLEDLSGLYEAADQASKITKDIVLLLNYALLRREPVAQIVFAFSAVEMLGQNENWNSDQRRLLNELAVLARETSIGSVSDREEVVTAILRNMHRLSLRQGVMRF